MVQLEVGLASMVTCKRLCHGADFPCSAFAFRVSGRDCVLYGPLDIPSPAGLRRGGRHKFYACSGTWP